MKKAFLLTLCLGLGCNAFGQGGGYLIFNNRIVSSVIAPIYGPDPSNPYLSLTGNPTNLVFFAGTQSYGGLALSGSNYFAQLFTAPGLNQPVSALQPQSPITSFRTGVAAGYIAGLTITANNLDPDSLGGATIQVRVWDNSSGSFDNWVRASRAWQDGTIAAGMSLPVNITAPIGGVFNVPPPLAGLEGFNIYFIPEPTFALLFVAGGVILWMCRRRR